MKHVTCNLTEVPAMGEARVLSFFGREVQVWRRGDRTRAASNTCLHLGGPLECKDGTVVCPWHGARFDMANGRHMDGRAPAIAHLMFLPAHIEEEELVYLWEEPS